MSGTPCQRTEVEDLVAAYRSDLLAAGQFAEHPVTSVARTFLAGVGLDGWARLPLADQCALPTKVRRVVSWLIVTGRLRPSADYLVACRPYLGEVAAHHHRALHDRYNTVSAELGYTPFVTRLQWSATMKVAALAGLMPDQLTKEALENGRVALTAALSRHRPGSHGAKALNGVSRYPLAVSSPAGLVAASAPRAMLLRHVLRPPVLPGPLLAGRPADSPPIRTQAAGGGTCPPSPNPRPQRQVRRARWQPADRLLLTALSRVLPRPAWSALLVSPETLLRWHRELIRGKWAAYVRRSPHPDRARPSELHQLILRLARDRRTVRWEQ